MDTPLHAIALPEADRATLKHPEAAALELLEDIAGALPRRQLTHAEALVTERGAR